MKWENERWVPQPRLANSGQCRNCQDINLSAFFGSSATYPAIPPMRVEHALDNEEVCRFCGLLIRALRQGTQLSHIVTHRAWPRQGGTTQPVKFHFTREHQQPIHDVDAGVTLPSGSFMQVRVYPPPSPLAEDNVHFKLCPIFTNQHHDNDDELQLSARVVAEDRIDLRVCQSWLQECLKLHSKICHDRSQIPQCDSLMSGLRFRVIDVVNECVSQQPQTCKYAALSYVWGQVDTLQLRLSNLAEMESPKGLRAIDPKIAKTVHDAMEVVKAMGLKFLWVDSLCIVQDGADKDAYIASMDQIYGSAIVTIVAASGLDANAGLAGVSAGSRHLSQMTQEVWHDLELAVSLPLPQELRDSVWASRAWTFQEQMLSQRFLVFRDGQAIWQCPCCIQFEDTAAEHKSGSYQRLQQIQGSWTGSTTRKRKLDTYLSRSDHLHRPKAFVEYVSVISEYSRKHLTYSQDILNAFEGLSRILEVRFSSRFVYGLPETYLDVALLWLPRTVLKRREIPGDKFPSWSWAGWAGEVGFEDTDETQRERIVPLIKWYTKQGDRSPALVNRVGIGIDEPRMGYEKSTNTYVWFPLFEALGQCIDSAPSIPLPAEHRTYLQFWTSCAYFQTMHKEDTRGSSNLEIASLAPPKKTIVKSAGGQVIGYLVLNGLGPLRTTVGRHEFIVLSEAQVSGFNPLTWANKFSEECQMYNVMLIEWNENGQVAERLGLGRILKGAWKGSHPRVKFVSLG